jgi:hypothetical protein
MIKQACRTHLSLLYRKSRSGTSLQRAGFVPAGAPTGLKLSTFQVSIGHVHVCVDFNFQGCSYCLLPCLCAFAVLGPICVERPMSERCSTKYQGSGVPLCSFCVIYWCFKVFLDWQQSVVRSLTKPGLKWALPARPHNLGRGRAPVRARSLAGRGAAFKLVRINGQQYTVKMQHGKRSLVRKSLTTMARPPAKVGSPSWMQLNELVQYLPSVLCHHGR